MTLIIRWYYSGYLCGCVVLLIPTFLEASCEVQHSLFCNFHYEGIEETPEGASLVQAISSKIKFTQTKDIIQFKKIIPSTKLIKSKFMVTLKPRIKLQHFTDFPPKVGWAHSNSSSLPLYAVYFTHFHSK